MKFTRYIVLEKTPFETNTYVGGRNPQTQFEPFELPNKLGKLFDRKSVAYKKAQKFQEAVDKSDFATDLIFSVQKVIIEFPDIE